MTDRAAWLAERKRGVGGSDVASLFNIGYGCTRRLWYDKTDTPPDFPREETKAMALGNVLEPFFADEYAGETGRCVHDAMESYVNASVPQVRVNIDRGVTIPGQADMTIEDSRKWVAANMGVLEIKSVSRGVFYTYKRQGLPVDYVLQLQHGMLATGWTWAAFCIGNRDSGEIMHWDVQRNEAICEKILEEVPKFWELVEEYRSSYIGGEPFDGIAPPRLEPDDRRCQSCQWRRTCQGSQLVQLEREGEIPQAEELRPLLSEYDARRSLFAEAEELLDETKAHLMSELGARQAVKVGERKVYFRPQEPRVIYDGKGLLSVYTTARKYLDGIVSTEGVPVNDLLRLPETFVDKSKPSRPLRIY